MNKDTIKDSVRDLVANWRNEADRKILDAVTCAATSSDSGFDPGKLLEQLSSPWAYPPIPDRAVAGHGAFDRLAAKFDRTMWPGSTRTFHGMEILVDDSLPPNTVRFVTRDGKVVQEFIIAQDSTQEDTP